MNPLRQKFFVASLIVATSLSFWMPVVHAQWGKNSVCPVMPGHGVKEKFFVDYKGERIYFCCRSCVKAFQKHPERYLKNLEVIHR